VRLLALPSSLSLLPRRLPRGSSPLLRFLDRTCTGLGSRKCHGPHVDLVDWTSKAVSRIRSSVKGGSTLNQATPDRTCTGLGQTTGALGVLQLTTAKYLENSLHTTKWRFKFAPRLLLDDKRLDFQGGLAYPLVREGGSTSNQATPGSWESSFPSRSILEPPKLCLICVLSRYNRALQHQLQHLNPAFSAYLPTMCLS
jgi:hypothetical protein